MDYNNPSDCYIYQKLDTLEASNANLIKQLKSTRFLILVVGATCGYLLKKHHDKIEALSKEIKELTNVKGE